MSHSRVRDHALFFHWIFLKSEHGESVTALFPYIIHAQTNQSIIANAVRNPNEAGVNLSLHSAGRCQQKCK